MHNLILAITSLMGSPLFMVLTPVGLVTGGAYIIGKELNK